MIQERAVTTLYLAREETAMKKEELAIIEGQKSLKTTDKKKSTDVIWQNFYDKAKEIRDQYKKLDTNFISTKNTVEYVRLNVFSPPFKEPDFSLEENKGKYVDMHVIYMDFLNISRLM